MMVGVIQRHRWKYHWPLFKASTCKVVDNSRVHTAANEDDVNARRSCNCIMVEFTIEL